MRVLFICSAHINDEPGPVVANQLRSLRSSGTEAEVFTINKKGVAGYALSIIKLRQFIRSGKNYDIFHAHYSFSGFVSSLAGATPVITSLMGSDLRKESRLFGITKWFIRHRWAKTIVKSPEMADQIASLHPIILPNGVDMDVFVPVPQEEARLKVGFRNNKAHVIFVSDPSRPEKNFKLAKSSVSGFDPSEVELHVIQNKTREELSVYYNAADILLLTSTREGSPNVIKEAMACNTPIVSTDVGDVRSLLKDAKNCIVSEATPEAISESISRILKSGERSDARQYVKHLDSLVVAEKMVQIYQKVLSE